MKVGEKKLSDLFKILACNSILLQDVFKKWVMKKKKKK